jgi:protein SHQ1
VELDVDGTKLKLFASPYYLSLTFPALVKEGTATYDPSTSMLNVKLPKETPGENFPDLDMLTKLIQPSKPPSELYKDDRKIGAVGIIEEVGRNPLEALEENQADDITDFNWEYPQELPPSVII